MSLGSDPGRSIQTLGASNAASVWDDVRLQRLWLSTQRREWRSLAIIGATKEVDTLWVAEMIAKLAWSYRGAPSCVFDLRDLSLRLVAHHEQDVATQVREGQTVTIALRSIFENPTAVPMARSADAVLLCLRLGVTDLKAAEQTIAEVGRDRLIGAIVVREAQGQSATTTPAKTGT
jgi:hypothetical protein